LDIDKQKEVIGTEEEKQSIVAYAFAGAVKLSEIKTI